MAEMMRECSPVKGRHNQVRTVLSGGRLLKINIISTAEFTPVSPASADHSGVCQGGQVWRKQSIAGL